MNLYDVTGNNMKENTENKDWSGMTYEEKSRQLFFREKKLLDTFLEHGAITKVQYEKSLHDLEEKMKERLPQLS